jgi:hypothetical protein
MAIRTRRICLVLAALALGGALPRGALAKGSRQFTFFAVMNGGQVIPPTPSNAMGVAFLTFDESTKRVCYSITYSQLIGTETEAHLHAGRAGQTNAVLYNLMPLGTPKVNCLGPIKPNEERLLKTGQMYIQIHTDVYVAGEIRGQVLPDPAAR